MHRVSLLSLAQTYSARTKCQIDYNVIRIEVRSNVTRRVREIRGRCTLWPVTDQRPSYTNKKDRNATYPVTRVDRARATLQVVWNIPRVTRPEPDLQEAARALHGIKAAPV